MRLGDLDALKDRFSLTGPIGVSVRRVIDEAPTIDAVEVKHGRWIEGLVIQTDISALYDYTCSECGIVISRESNYCPNCGCRMDKDGE